MSDPSRLFWPLKGHGKNASRGSSKGGRRETVLRPCDHPGCRDGGEFRAPKSRETLTDYFWFCLDHVRAYNASWNFYEGLDADEIERLLRIDVTWDRPTWPMGRHGSGARFDATKVRDNFGIFGEEFGDSLHEKPQASSAELSAMREMNLKAPLTVDSLRMRYKELCKLHHPDANGGAKEAEERFKRIGQAYKTLLESLM